MRIVERPGETLDFTIEQSRAEAAFDKIHDRVDRIEPPLLQAVARLAFTMPFVGLELIATIGERKLAEIAPPILDR